MEESIINSQDRITCVQVTTKWLTFRDILAMKMFYEYQAQKGHVNPPQFFVDWFIIIRTFLLFLGFLYNFSLYVGYITILNFMVLTFILQGGPRWATMGMFHA